MAPANEAPASAEGLTSHTQNQPAKLTAPQLRLLFRQVHPNRVQQLQGMSHMEAWDIRRELIRVFGFGGYSTETLALDLVAERETKQGDRSRWTVVYRAQVRLIVFDIHGRELGRWDDASAGSSVNQPSLGDAHDMAMKTSLSQALKRCATNLGDQFGLSLYNDGSTDAVVTFSAAHPPEQWQQNAEAPPEPEDPPVKPEPQAAPAVDYVQAAPANAPTQDVAAIDVLKTKVSRGWGNLDATRQNLAEAAVRNLGGILVPSGLDGQMVTVTELLKQRIAELEAAKRGENVGSAA